jgi:S1-C subfamily serine protease
MCIHAGSHAIDDLTLRKTDSKENSWGVARRLFSPLMSILFAATGTLGVAAEEIQRVEMFETPTAAAAAQKVVLYEEDPADPNGKRFVGSAIWRTETVTPGPGLPPELAVRADVEVPERKLAMTWSLRRNTDKSLPATHTIEIMFKLPADFPAGGISGVPGILMKQAESTRGVALAGHAVKVTPGFYLVGLSNGDAEKERNLQLLKEQGWFDIPVIYSNNRRAIVSLEKGASGEHAFEQAFKWGGQDRAKSRTGSGFFITSAGHVLTNSHVVEGCVRIRVRVPWDGIVPATVIARVASDDLAVLKTDTRAQVVATLRTVPSLRTGESIVIFGFPLSGLLASTGNATSGIITALAGLQNDPGKMQISAPVQPGNSGGPVLDMGGNVVGIVQSKLDALRAARVPGDILQNINFATKASTAANFLNVHGITYKSGQPGKELSIPDIVDRAKAFSIEMRCEN